MRYYELIEKLTGIPAKKMEKYAENNSVENWFTALDVIGATEPQKAKVEALLDFINLHQQMGTINENGELCSSVAAMKFCASLLRYKSREEMWVVVLSNKNRVLGSVMVSSGSINESPVFVRDIVEAVLKYKRASAVIVCHNHPGGSIKPSTPDINVTRHIKAGLETIRIRLLDHVIVTDTEAVSFAERGML